jgi:hypothetical protein
MRKGKTSIKILLLSTKTCLTELHTAPSQNKSHSVQGMGNAAMAWSCQGEVPGQSGDEDKKSGNGTWAWGLDMSQTGKKREEG